MFCLVPSFSQTMEWHIKDNYVDIKYLGNDIFKVKNSNGKWGIINEYGETTVEIQYDSITTMVENRALLLDITGEILKGIINEKGQLIKSFADREILVKFQCFKEGMLAYGVWNNKAGCYYFGYLDINGNTRIEPKYYWAAPFNNGKAVIQYTSNNYGLINQSGVAILNDNRKFKFMSTPVDSKLLVAVTGRRGEKVTMVSLAPDGKLYDIEDLEDGTLVKKSTDYRSLLCHNGHIYYFDDAMRLLSSSTGRTFNEPLSYTTTFPVNSNFMKMSGQGGWQILYSGSPLFQSPFMDITFCGNDYAIVTSRHNSKGVLKLNHLGNISIQNVPQKAEFYHHAAVTGNLSVNINGLFSSSQVQIGVVGLMGNAQEEKFTVPVGSSGIYNQPLSYFIPAMNLESEVELPIIVNLYIDGMLYKAETRTLTGVHKRAFRVSDANAPEFSAPDGNAVITFNVQSLNSAPSPSARIRVRGASNQVRYFNGAESVAFKVPVTIPVESMKTFSFTVTIEEDGCPSYTRTISRTIKHYDLQ